MGKKECTGCMHRSALMRFGVLLSPELVGVQFMTGFQAVLHANMSLDIFQRQASSPTHVQLNDMSQHPQQIVHYAPLAALAVTKQNWVPVVIDDNDDNGGHYTNHNR